ncbi:hypothetical protein V6Z12_A05G299700 [Gossypium hirsutum]
MMEPAVFQTWWWDLEGETSTTMSSFHHSFHFCSTTTPVHSDGTIKMVYKRCGLMN